MNVNNQRLSLFEQALIAGRLEGRQSGVSRAAQSAPTVRQVPAQAGTHVRPAVCQSEQVNQNSGWTEYNISNPEANQLITCVFDSS